MPYAKQRTVFWNLSFYFYLNAYKLDDSFIFIWKKILCNISLFLCHILSFGSSGLSCKFIRREYGFSINSIVRCRSQANFDFENLNQNFADFDILQILMSKLYFLVQSRFEWIAFCWVEYCLFFKPLLKL